MEEQNKLSGMMDAQVKDKTERDNMKTGFRDGDVLVLEQVQSMEDHEYEFDNRVVKRKKYTFVEGSKITNQKDGSLRDINVVVVPISLHDAIIDGYESLGKEGKILKKVKVTINGEGIKTRYAAVNL